MRCVMYICVHMVYNQCDEAQRNEAPHAHHQGGAQERARHAHPRTVRALLSRCD